MLLQSSSEAILWIIPVSAALVSAIISHHNWRISSGCHTRLLLGNLYLRNKQERRVYPNTRTASTHPRTLPNPKLYDTELWSTGIRSAENRAQIQTPRRVRARESRVCATGTCCRRIVVGQVRACIRSRGNSRTEVRFRIVGREPAMPHLWGARVGCAETLRWHLLCTVKKLMLLKGFFGKMSSLYCFINYRDRLQ